jgi:hypothetical protein
MYRLYSVNYPICIRIITVIRTVDGIQASDMTNLSGIGMRTLRDNLVIRANQGDQLSINALSRLATVFQQTLHDSNLRGHIPADVARAMHDLAVSHSPHVDPVILQDIEDRVTDQGVVLEIP